MAIIYRYTDLADETIKYVGIIWSGNRTLKQRVEEHLKNDDWIQKRAWRIEYLHKEISSRTDAEYLEAHYISKFETSKYYNTAKANWGESNLIDDSKDEWIIYSTDEKPVSKWDHDGIITKTEILYDIRGRYINLTINNEFTICLSLATVHFQFSKGAIFSLANSIIVNEFYSTLLTQKDSMKYEDISSKNFCDEAMSKLFLGREIKYVISEIDGKVSSFCINGVMISVSPYLDEAFSCIHIADFINALKDRSSGWRFEEKDYMCKINVPVNVIEEFRRIAVPENDATVT